MTNDITPRKLEELTLGEVIGYYSEDFQRKNNITIGTKIPVMSEMNCVICHTPFMSQSIFDDTCSEKCQDQADHNADNWGTDR